MDVEGPIGGGRCGERRRWSDGGPTRGRGERTARSRRPPVLQFPGREGGPERGAAVAVGAGRRGPRRPGGHLRRQPVGAGVVRAARTARTDLAAGGRGVRRPSTSRDEGPPDPSAMGASALRPGRQQERGAPAKEATQLPQEAAALDFRTIHRAAAIAEGRRAAARWNQGWYRSLMDLSVPRPPVTGLNRAAAVGVYQLRAGHYRVFISE